MGLGNQMRPRRVIDEWLCEAATWYLLISLGSLTLLSNLLYGALFYRRWREIVRRCHNYNAPSLLPIPCSTHVLSAHLILNGGNAWWGDAWQVVGPLPHRTTVSSVRSEGLVRIRPCHFTHHSALLQLKTTLATVMSRDFLEYLVVSDLLFFSYHLPSSRTT
jgi:hypothetical protein